MDLPISNKRKKGAKKKTAKNLQHQPSDLVSDEELAIEDDVPLQANVLLASNKIMLYFIIFMLIFLLFYDEKNYLKEEENVQVKDFSFSDFDFNLGLLIISGNNTDNKF
ncbi:hypothetical protein BpHYR1_018874 [Brachionus plicatilis]|uniref:Uncharacterized protein n=1 Tax=Brachionus plicatilis TaxID=10195 RepID=A0A3M7QGV4_BRAPC|nr:hypothetical protein BpHYR1_018874 [Brachionus plicatilis]